MLSIADTASEDAGVGSDNKYWFNSLSCAVCGAPGRMGCPCRGIAFCGAVCAASGAHAHARVCKFVVMRSGRGGRGSGGGGGRGGGGGGVRVSINDAGNSIVANNSGGGSSGDSAGVGLDGATVRKAASAIARLGSRKPTEAAAGLERLSRMIATETRGVGRSAELARAVVVAGGMVCVRV